MDLNLWSGTGHLTKDAELKNFPTTGKKFLQFSLANNTGYGDFAKVSYFDCIFIGDKRAENLHRYLNKGTHVALAGRLEEDRYIDKEGVNRKTWKLTVNELILLGGNRQRTDDNDDRQEDLEFGSSFDASLKRQVEERAKDPFGKKNKGNEEVTF